MEAYKNLLREVLEDGVWQENRTGIKTKFIPGAMIKLDLEKGFPVGFLRKTAPKSAMAEMQGFLRGYTNAAQFRELGCKFWDGNANEPIKGTNISPWLSSPFRKGIDDIGEVYGYFWRNWIGDDGTKHDQVMDVLNTIINNPYDRRMVVSGWKVEAIKQIRGALPPCHDSWTVMTDVQNKLMHLSWRQRSVDTILGTPANVVGYAFLLELLARLTGYTPKYLIGHFDNVHIYENHMFAVEEMLERENLPLPNLVFSKEVPEYKENKLFQPEWINKINNTHLFLENYQYHPAIEGLTMAV